MRENRKNLLCSIIQHTVLNPIVIYGKDYFLIQPFVPVMFLIFIGIDTEASNEKEEHCNSSLSVKWPFIAATGAIPQYGDLP